MRQGVNSMQLRHSWLESPEGALLQLRLLCPTCVDINSWEALLTARKSCAFLAYLANTNQQKMVSKSYLARTQS
jgi:hypothetical protein